MTSTVQDLSQRTAVITGAASGIGAASARVLAERGAKVALLSRRRDRIDGIARAINDSGGRAVAVQTDVNDKRSVARAVTGVGEAFGGVDAVVNVAGVMLPNPLEAGREDEWDQMLSTNLRGVLRVTHAFLPQLLAAADADNPSDLLNVSSIGARIPFPGYAVYGATKAAVSHLSRTLRTELGPRGVRVTNVEPGLTHSELADHVDNDALSGQLQGMFDELAALRSEDVAEVIGFALSRPRHVNLEQLVVVPTDQA